VTSTREDPDVSSTASPTSVAQLLRGVDEPRPGQFRVRLQFPGAPRRHEEYLATADAANARILALREMRKAGLHPETAPRSLTLGEAAREVLEIRTVSGDLQAGGLEWWARILRPWLAGPFADVPVHLLNPAKVASAHRERSAKHPKSAKDELIGLKATLRHARSEGARIPERLLDLQPPKLRTRKRKALAAADRDTFAMGAPAAYVRLVMLQARIGNRIGELLQLRRCDVNLDDAQLTVPEPKEEARTGAKVIPLFPDEVALLREQLAPFGIVGATPTSHLPVTADRSPDALVWPMPDGRAWPMVAGRVAHAYFHRHVWAPTMAAAGLEGYTSHDLRATAITIMLDRGVSRETCATRVGHADATLINRVYDQGDALARAAREMAAIHANEAAAASATSTPRTAAATTEKGR